MPEFELPHPVMTEDDYIIKRAALQQALTKHYQEVKRVHKERKNEYIGMQFKRYPLDEWMTRNKKTWEEVYNYQKYGIIELIEDEGQVFVYFKIKNE